MGCKGSMVRGIRGVSRLQLNRGPWRETHALLI